MAKGLKGFLEKLFGSKSARDMKKLAPMLESVKAAREPLATLSDEDLQDRRRIFKERLDAGETLDDLLPEAFGVVWEACRRLAERKASWPVWEQDTVWDMVPYDVQIIGSIVLHDGKIAEMATGEGKTLVAMMPLYLNSLSGGGAHLITVNDYLARRDAEWMGGVLTFLGCTVRFITNDMTPDQRREAYAADVTYGTNNEFGFDYLRDNMAISPENLVQRGFNFAIVDEVDSVLIDEARTPLIISGAVAKSTHRFEELKPRVDKLVRQQAKIVNNWLSDVERIFRNADDGEGVKIDDESALMLLRISRGAPKNRRFRRMVQIPGVLETIKRTEEAYMANKAMWEADEDLLYVVEEKHRSVDLTEKGRDVLAKEEEDFFVLPDLAEMTGEIQQDDNLSEEEKAKRLDRIQQQYALKNEQIANVDQLIRAYSLYAKDDEYVIQDGKIVIVDEFTGRIMPGRRFSEGLHQALEAKEGVKVEKETQTLATVTIQNFFRMYEKLSGMTGTAETEEAEFGNIYGLSVSGIPTNRPIARVDSEDVIYRTKKEKYKAIVAEVARLHQAGHPVLVGTTTVEVSELLSRLLRGQRINHNVLNAKQHKNEAEIVAEAGRRGAVTIATNMAGRGTDIKLEAGILEIEGENSEETNGLHIIGTERHESRRIDNQLRGRAGRQGDEGSSRFFLSLEDDLMRLFSPDRLIKVMDRLGVEEDEVITHRMVTRAIEKAQVKVEQRNFDIRKHLLEYDDVVNRQREVIYSLRRETLLEEDISEIMHDYIEDSVDEVFREHVEVDGPPDYWDIEGLARDYRALVLSPLELKEDELKNMGGEAIRQMLLDDALQRYRAKESRLTAEITHKLEKFVLLQTIDEHWRDHLNELLMLRSGIGLRSYAQRDPLLEYKSEAFTLFESLMRAVREGSVRLFFRAELAVQPPPEQVQQMQERKQEVDTWAGGRPAGAAQNGGQMAQRPPEPGKPQPVEREEPKVGRNDPCPCGSGKKYKKCCGK